ncbi:hypothetical protein [Flavobacterium sp.]|uniref:hypothetical protein n=1 Tax=Flavobacterium sp. TaxID=239 RepID=UPI003D1081BB
MLYFKILSINKKSSKEIEIKLRQFASKRNFSLDFSSSTTDRNELKKFLGLEDDKSLKLTRLRSSFEIFLPKIILKFDKSTGYTVCKIRLCFLSSFMFLIISISILFGIYNSIKTNQLENDLYDSILFLALFIILTQIEIYLSKVKIKKTLNS